MRELADIGFRGITLAIFVDDMGFAVFQHISLVTTIMNDLAALLGLIYKQSKDVIGVHEMKFIGFDIDTETDRVRVRVPVAYITKLRALLLPFITNPRGHTIGVLESLVGKIQHASSVIVEVRQHLRSSYNLLTAALGSPPAVQSEWKLWRRDMATTEAILTPTVQEDLCAIR